jgi:hypothetical protein
MKNVTARKSYTIGPIASHDTVLRSLPKIESMVISAIAMKVNLEKADAFETVTINVFDLAKALGVNHEQASDAIRSLTTRRFHVVGDRGTVFEYKMLYGHAFGLKHTDKPIEVAIVSLPYDVKDPDEDVDISWASDGGTVKELPHD